MRLESAVYTGASGIISHGQAIAVVGNNISNSNTTAFKESRAEFTEILSKSFEGGTNGAQQQGSGGSRISSVKELFTAGVLEGTGRELDAGIDGDGFFMVGDPASPLLTRAGTFGLDEAGNLTTPSGLDVLGTLVEGGPLAPINLYNLNLTAQATTATSAKGNLSATSAITTVPPNPNSFQELSASASFSQGFNVYDSLGASKSISVSFFKTAAGTFTAQAYIDGGEVGQTAGTPVAIGNPVTLNFSETGVLTNTQAAATITATPAYAGGAAAGNFTIDLSGFTQFATVSNLSNITRNGQGAGNIKGYNISTNGEIYAELDTGDSKLIGTLQLANYPNKDALERIGSNLYRPLENAGEATIGNPQTGSLGAIRGGTLERSTVDLATQFTNVILLQRGYQANAQMMNKATELIQQTLQLIR
jgi:flagellar hook protein FlgE